MLSRHNALTEWTKSSYSGPHGSCVEVKAQNRQLVRVRDSKDVTLPGLGFSAAIWTEFVRDIDERDLSGA